MPDTAVLRDMECRRLRALVEADLTAADALHADGYELITPNGYVLGKQEYLGGIASGELRYQVFEPVSEIVVRAVSQAAILRYRARITVQAGGPLVSMTCWHTDYYERVDGIWQAVWSQATTISSQDV
jgi:Domain of unknown function (DUF4440)